MPAIRRCTNCQQRGHFRNRCTNPATQRLCVKCGNPVKGPVKGAQCQRCYDAQRRPRTKNGCRVPHHCGHCGAAGHIIRTCAAAKEAEHEID